MNAITKKVRSEAVNANDVNTPNGENVDYGIAEALAREKEYNRRKHDEAPVKINEATVIGDLEAPEVVALLNQTVVYGVAAPEPGKFTYGGGWSQLTHTWKEVIDGWLTKHPEQSAKGGASFFFAESELTGEVAPTKVFAKDTPHVKLCYKTKGKIRVMYAIQIDIDGKSAVDDVVDRLRSAGICAVAYTTFSNAEKGSPGNERFRVIILLAKPFTFRPDPDRPDKSWGPDLAEWQALYAGVCDLFIPVKQGVDSAGFTPSQLMYTPARPIGAVYKHYVIAGRGLDLSTVQHGNPKDYEAPIIRQTGGGGESYSGEPAILPDRFNLRSWYGDNRSNFLVSDFLDAIGWGAYDQSGGGHVITCPNHGSHTSGSDDAWVIDGPDADSESAVIACLHSHCRHLHTTDLLKMVADQIESLPDQYKHFSEMLCDPAYYADDVDCDPVNRDDYIAEGVKIEWLETSRGVKKAFAALTDKSPEAAYSTIYAGIVWAGAVTKAVDVFNELLLKVERFKDRDRTRIQSQGRKLAADHKKKFGEKKAAENGEMTSKETGIPNVSLSDSFRVRREKIYQLMTASTDTPTIFHRNQRLVDIQIDELGNPNIHGIDAGRFKAHVETRIDFDGEPAEQADINWVINQPRVGYPALRGLTAAPVFGPDMSLITEPGYHEASGLHYTPKEGVVVPVVSDIPTTEEVARAVDDLLDLLSDFPFDGHTTRQEVTDAVKNGDDVPSFCHALSVPLSFVCRAFINGPVPGHFAGKDKPRTGATKLMGLVSHIGMLTGSAAPQTLPMNPEEMNKTLMANLDSGKGIVFFDNLPKDVEIKSGILAGFLTANPLYTGRLLGGGHMQEVEKKTVPMFTGNQTRWDDELRLRLLKITLDPKMERPEERSGFRYNLDEHMRENAPKYLHALLTMVQHWKAKGCVLWKGKPLGGFESHNAIIGGILDTAGVKGFLTNNMAVQDAARNDTPQDMLMDAMITSYYKNLSDKKPGTVFRAFGDEKMVSRVKDKASDQMVTAPYAGYTVVSIKALLEGHGIALTGAGYAKDESNGVTYNDSSKTKLCGVVGAMGGTVREWRADRDVEGTTTRQGRYVFKRLGSDGDGTFYGLEVLPLVA